MTAGEGESSAQAASRLASRLARYAFAPKSQPASPETRQRVKSEPVATTPTTSPLKRVKLERDDHTPSSPSTRPRSRPWQPGSDHKRQRSAVIKKEDPEEQIPDDEEEEVEVEEEQRRALTPTPKSKGKVKKKPRPFAGPEVYGHLKPVTDILQEGLDIVFVGINPGQTSSARGHHFAHPTNKFWRALSGSGLTARLLDPSEDRMMPELYNYGHTNLCNRPTAEQSELSPLEMRLAVLPLCEKVQRYHPRIACFVGKRIWDIFEGVAGKTATDARRPSGEVMEAADLEDIRDIKPLNEGEISLPVSPVGILPQECAVKGNAKSPRTKGKAKAGPPFDWTAPRQLRLPGGSPPGTYTYFWVVPNTSGLERTPLPEQIVLFGHLRRFSESIQAGVVPPGLFRDIDLVGLSRTTEEMVRKVKSAS